MYTIVMNQDKSLSQTEVTTLYQGENLVDKIRFLIPLKYGDLDLSEFSSKLKYIDQGNVIHLEGLELSEKLYKDCMLCYYLPIRSKLTKFAGDIAMQISFDKDGQNILHTSETIITIHSLHPGYQYFIDDTAGDSSDNILGDYELVTKNDIDSLFPNDSGDSYELVTKDDIDSLFPNDSGDSSEDGSNDSSDDEEIQDIHDYATEDDIDFLFKNRRN